MVGEKDGGRADRRQGGERRISYRMHTGPVAKVGDERQRDGVQQTMDAGQRHGTANKVGGSASARSRGTHGRVERKRASLYASQNDDGPCPGGANQTKKSHFGRSGANAGAGM